MQVRIWNSSKLFVWFEFAGDVWLSLKYRPPVTISDTACTFASNLCKYFHNMS